MDNTLYGDSTTYTDEEHAHIIDYVCNVLNMYGFKYYPSKIYKDAFEDTKSSIYHKHNWVKRIFGKIFPVKMREVKRNWISFHIYENEKTRIELSVEKEIHNIERYIIRIADNGAENYTATLGNIDNIEQISILLNTIPFLHSRYRDELLTELIEE